MFVRVCDLFPFVCLVVVVWLIILFVCLFACLLVCLVVCSFLFRFLLSVSLLFCFHMVQCVWVVCSVNLFDVVCSGCLLALCSLFRFSHGSWSYSGPRAGSLCPCFVGSHFACLVCCLDSCLLCFSFRAWSIRRNAAWMQTCCFCIGELFLRFLFKQMQYCVFTVVQRAIFLSIRNNNAPE